MEIEKVDKDRREEDKKIVNELRQKINESVWELKFYEFNENYVVKSAENL